MRFRIAFRTLAFVAFVNQIAVHSAAQTVGFKEDEEKIVVTVDGASIATYVYNDAKLPRPYFKHLRAGGVQVTRNHPPIAGKDATDHADMHPGLWFALGDLSGADNWRLKAPVRHDRFLDEPKARDGKGSFAVKNRCLANDGKNLICEQTCRFTFVPRPNGNLLMWDAEFRSADADFSFGDQEEMGLGVRVATPLTVKAGGQILTSDGQKNEKQVRGKSSPWCDYSGIIDGKHAGITLMQHPKNFRAAWYHARDYGLIVANPFGKKALVGGETSKVIVKKGETFRLRYGVFVHAADVNAKPDLAGEYQLYLKAAGND